MSTEKTIREFERSWSEENLFHVQTKERIHDLEATVELLRRDKQALQEKLDGAHAESQEKSDKIDKLHVQIYDLTRSTKLLKKKLERRKRSRARKPNQRKKKKSGFQATKFVDANKEKEAASRKKWKKQSGIATEFLDKHEKTADDGDDDVDDDDEEDADEQNEDIFDLEAVAAVFPAMPIKMILDVEKRFIEADEDGSGLIEENELMAVVKAEKCADAVKEIIAEEGLDVEGGLDFLACLKIYGKLGSRRQSRQNEYAYLPQSTQATSESDSDASTHSATVRVASTHNTADDGSETSNTNGHHDDADDGDDAQPAPLPRKRRMSRIESKACLIM